MWQDRSHALPGWDAPWLRVVAAVVAGILFLAGVWLFVYHVTTDPLVDARAYWEAGRRLNEGLPLYNPSATEATGLYLYPPLLAILFRPLALLPFSVAGPLWELLMIGAVILTFRQVGLGRPVLLTVGLLGVPLGWSLAIGQVEPLLTLLLTIAAPWSVALAGQLKIIPWLAAVYWLGRRDWRALRSLVTWIVVLFLVQLVIEPGATISFLKLEWAGPALNVRNWSLFAVHPVLWVVFVGALFLLALRAAGGRWGWPLAVVLAVLAYPRLLVYQLWSLMAVYGRPVDRDAVPMDQAGGWLRSGRDRLRSAGIVRR
jgi:hypothetical protein